MIPAHRIAAPTIPIPHLPCESIHILPNDLLQALEYSISTRSQAACGGNFSNVIKSTIRLATFNRTIHSPKPVFETAAWVLQYVPAPIIEESPIRPGGQCDHPPVTGLLQEFFHCLLR